MAEGKVLVGTAGWSYEDWKGNVYPSKVPRGFDPLAYMAGFFDCLEINSTFYRPPSPQVARSWARRVSRNQEFRFTVKLWQGFTHKREAISGEDVRGFLRGVEPLREEGALGCLLIQFPWSFKNVAENRSYLAQLLRQFQELPRAVELRHASWDREDSYRFLADEGAGFVNIDQPLFHRSMAPSSRATSPVGYVRLHGRNWGDWFREGAGRDARYDYLYSEEELEPWLENIRRVAQSAEVTFVITNNHYRGQAACNALQIKATLHGRPIPVPPSLASSFPQLEPLTEARLHLFPQGP
ncbi:MAG: DUF72 domain-containing protein [Nitrospinota bacterium]